MRKYKEFKQLADSKLDKKTRGYIQTLEELDKACRRKRNLEEPEGLMVGINNLRTKLEKRRRNITDLRQEEEVSILLNAVDKIEGTLNERLASV
ncbi:hypothetical protein UT300012_21570 [Paraclostridium bifermentans]